MMKEMIDLDKIREDYELHLGNREFKGIVVAGILIGLLVFALGFLVGRQFPGRILPERLAGEVSPPVSQTAAAETDEPTEKSPAYAFYKELSGTEGDVPSAGEAPAQTSPAATTPSRGAVDEGKDLQSAPAELTVAPPSETPAPTAHKIRIIPSLYTVQIGAFEEASAAEKLSHRLQQKGYPAYTMIKRVPEKGVWHRVRVGRYSKRAEAESVVDQLEQREHLSGFITLYAKSTEMQ